MLDDNMPFAADNVIRSWCFRETAVWKCRGIDFEAAVADYQQYNRSRMSTFLFSLKNGQVSILDKPEYFTRNQLDAEDWLLASNGYLMAALSYRDFLRCVAQTLCADLDTTLALDVDDNGFTSETAPVFVVQKLLENNSLLMPHEDFIMQDFHEGVCDSIPYADKSLMAIFAGGTSGPEHVTAEVVQKLSIPRVRAAVFFKDNPRIDFRLPVIGQCTPEAAELLRALGFGTGKCSWDYKFRHKFLISMDGNAGTCGRLTIGLKSDCVPLKYESPHVLHYSRHLVPWLHYVPITSDPDVELILDLEQDQPGLFEPVALEGKRFFESFLSRQQIINYTGQLIRAYSNSFRKPAKVSRKVDIARPAATLRPGHPYAQSGFGHSYHRFGNMLRSTGDIAGAEAAYRKAIELDPAVPIFHGTLAELLYSQGRTREALIEMELLIGGGGGDPHRYFQLGKILERLGDLAAAEAAFRQAAKSEPSSDLYRTALAESLRRQAQNSNHEEHS